MLARMRRKTLSFALLMGTQTGAATLENSMEVPQKIKNSTTLWPAIALLGIYPRDTGVLFRRDTCTPMFVAVLLAIAKVWKEPKCPSTDEQIKKMWYIYMCVCVCVCVCVYTHNGVLLGNQKEWNLAICNCVDGTEGYYAVKLVREGQVSYDFTHMRNLRY